MTTNSTYLFALAGLICSTILHANSPDTPETEAQKSASRVPGAVAMVNGEPIYIEDLERKLASLHAGTAEQATAAPDFEVMMFGLVNDQLLAQEARAMGLQNEEPVKVKVDDLRVSLAKQSLERQEVGRKASPDANEVESSFRDLYQRISFHIITVRDRDEADEIRARLKNGEEFAPLVETRSIDQYSRDGGWVENLERRNVPDQLAEDAFAAKPGELIGPIPTSIGWAILEIESIQDADPERFEQVAELVESVVRQRRREELERELAARLKQRHRVTVDNAVVESVVLEKVSDGRILPRAENPDAIVARVGNRAITAEDYRVALGRGLRSIGNETIAASIKPVVLESMIHDELLKVEALSRGLDKQDEIERSARAFESELLVTRYLEEVLGPSVEVSAKETEQYYQEHKSEFQIPPKVRVGRITINDDAVAGQVVSLLEQGTDPAWLARKHSIDDRRETGGDLGWIQPGELGFPMIDRSLYDAQPGQVFGPVPVGPNFAVFFVTAREEQGIYPYEQISGNVRQAAASAKLFQKIHQTLQTLRDQSDIIVYEDALDGLSITASPEDKAHGDLSTPGH